METPKRSLASTLYNQVRSEMPDPGDLHDSLAAVAPESMVLPALLANASTSKVPTRFGQFPKGSVVAVQQRIYSDCIMNVYDGIEYPPLPVSNKMVAIVASRPLTREKQLKVDGLDCTRSEAHRYETLTRLQSQNSLWHKLRKDRLSASKMHSVKTRTKNFDVLVGQLKKSTRVTQAMADGLADEPLAVEQYAQVHGHVMNVYPCGIIVNPWASWLAASPDRKVYLPNRQPPFGILEVKCPRVSSVLDTSYLQRVGDHLVLRRSHGYYTQVLTQLAVTGLDWCAFFVWCLNDYHMETIHVDPLAWQDIKDKQTSSSLTTMCDGRQLLDILT